MYNCSLSENKIKHKLLKKKILKADLTSLLKESFLENTR